MKLEGKTVAILATNGFEQSELFEPKRALDKAGATPIIVSLEEGAIRGVKGHDWADSVEVDQTVDTIAADQFDALVLPGGVYNPDTLRQSEKAVAFIRAMVAENKPVAAICHGPWLLVEADVLRGRRATSYGSIKRDMVNAGADWVDQPVVVDNGLVTSRTPDDLDEFCRELIEQVGGQHAQQSSADRATAGAS